MSIDAKHAYRFEYLKSEEWKTVRIAALAREHGKCQICSEESISNDAHHMWYPESIWETTERHLIILCRPCHNFIHAMRPDCKTNDMEKGQAEWNIFLNAITVWRLHKKTWLDGLPEQEPRKTKDLRDAYRMLKIKYRQLLQTGTTTGTARDAETFEEQVEQTLTLIQKWAGGFSNYANRVNFEVAATDFQI